MLKCASKADFGQLSDIIKMGGTLMRVNLSIDGEGRVDKIPTERNWQQDRPLGISTLEELELDVGSGVQAFGFHPEDIGLYVIDLDEKGSKSGYETLSRIVGSPKWLTDPEVYCETPNGTHLFFNLKSVPEELRESENGILLGVDIRASKKGWLMAPGSIGWSINDEEWKHYTLEGYLKDAPDFPEELIRHFQWARDLKERRDNKKDSVQEMPSYISGPGAEFQQQELRYSELLDLVDKNMTPDIFHRLVNKYVPAAEWDEKSKSYRTGDLTGLTRGKSCLFTPRTYKIKDFNDSSHGMGFTFWLSKHGGMTFQQACRAVLEVAGVPDPTAVKISRESVQEIAKETVKESKKAEEETQEEAQDSEEDNFYSVQYPYTDIGNAERFVAMWKGKVLYSCEEKGWLWYESGIWKRKATAKIQRAAKNTVRSIRFDQVPEEYKKTKFAWQKACEGSGHFKAMQDLASTEEDIYTFEETFDLRNDLFPVKNGVIDLKTGELLPHSPDYRFTMASTVEYSITATCPRFEKFMHQITMGRKDLAQYLQYFFGYCLTGEISEQIFPVFYGTGGNGKSVLINLINKVMGDFSGALPADTLTAKNQTDDKRASLAAAKGTRIQVMSESRESGTLDTALVKSATGGDPITCRHLFGRFFTYVPTFKIVLLTNHKPRISAIDDGIWRRVRNVPFDFSAEKSGEVNKNLENELSEELPGILLWVVRGAVLYYANGKKLCQSETIDKATADYKDQENIFKAFLDERCVVGPDEWEKPGDVVNAFNNWLVASGNGRTKKRTSDVQDLMIQNGFKREATSKNHVKWVGFRLLSRTAGEIDEPWGNE